MAIQLTDEQREQLQRGESLALTPGQIESIQTGRYYFVSLRSFTYGNQLLYPGQYVEPLGFRNDKAIFDLDNHSTAPVATRTSEWTCPGCQRQFHLEWRREQHQRTANCGLREQERQSEQPVSLSEDRL